MNKQQVIDYMFLFGIESDIHGRITDVLNRNRASHLTVCPHCRVDDFAHREGCPIYEYAHLWESDEQLGMFVDELLGTEPKEQ